MNNHPWNKIRGFENEYKKRLLRRMSQKKSIDIFLGLYQLIQELLNKKYFSTFDQEKIKSLIRIHSLSGRVK